MSFKCDCVPQGATSPQTRWFLLLSLFSNCAQNSGETLASGTQQGRHRIWVDSCVKVTPADLYSSNRFWFQGWYLLRLIMRLWQWYHITSLHYLDVEKVKNNQEMPIINCADQLGSFGSLGLPSVGDTRPLCMISLVWCKWWFQLVNFFQGFERWK